MNNGMLGSAAGISPFGQALAPFMDRPERYALVYWQVPEGTEGGAIGSAVWKTQTLNKIAYNEDDIIEGPLVGGVVRVKPGKYRVRACTQLTQMEGAAGRIFDVGRNASVAWANMFTGTGGRLTSTMIHIDNTIEVRHAGGLRFDVLSTSGGNAAAWATGLAYGAGTTGLDEIHALMELWEEIDR